MFTDLQKKILAILIENPRKEFYLSQLGTIIGKHPGVFQKGLKSLEKEGIVSSRRQGNQRLFRANAAYPLIDEISSIIRKSSGVEALLRGGVERINGIETAFIYGSYAKGKMRADSDIDLLIVASDMSAEDTLMKRLSEVEHKTGREINYKIYSAAEFSEKIAEKDPFLSEIMSEKIIMLKGAL